MAQIVAFLLLFVSCSCAAQDIIPRSISPDGTRALMSEPRLAHAPWTPAKVWVVELPSKRKLSRNLIATDEQAYTVRLPRGVRTLFTSRRKQPTLQADQLLFDLISGVAREGEQSAGGSVNYEVRWSDDLRRVTVSGGAHKFSHDVIFHLVGRQFRRAKIAYPSLERTRLTACRSVLFR
jgi:hypothetical protein